MSAKRSDWRTRVCTHGNRVEHRLQIDAAYCNEPGCAALALSLITMAIPDPSREAMREALEAAIDGLETGLGLSMLRHNQDHVDFFTKRIAAARAALALDGDVK